MNEILFLVFFIDFYSHMASIACLLRLQSSTYSVVVQMRCPPFHLSFISSQRPPSPIGGNIVGLNILQESVVAEYISVSASLIDPIIIQI